MLRLPLIAASLAALALPLDARAAGGIAFDRATAEPNEHVRVTSALDVPLRLHLKARLGDVSLVDVVLVVIEG